MTMSDQSVNDGGYAFARPAFAGISQRRLLAGMILSGWLSGNYANQNSEPWTVEGAVYESLKYADELIKQTEET